MKNILAAQQKEEDFSETWSLYFFKNLTFLSLLLF